jgi:hypothetical protein
MVNRLYPIRKNYTPLGEQDYRRFEVNVAGSLSPSPEKPGFCKGYNLAAIPVECLDKVN